MAEDPRSARDHALSLNSRKDEISDSGHLFPDDPTSEAIADIARKLASHGGGPASLDLAIDIFLHDIVKRAREATGATGAAIALSRSGEVVCRATTGENAPDLGVRVETTSGLVGACLNTGKIQYCRDAETDLQANREACKQLRVRSMLVIPLGEADGIAGVLEVFSSSPNAFGEKEVALLRSLARRIAGCIKDVRQRANTDPGDYDPTLLSRAHEVAEHEEDDDGLPQQRNSSHEALNTKTGELWTTVLFALVIAAAIALGVVVGWSHGVKARANRTTAKPTSTTLESGQKDQASPTSAGSSVSPKATIPGTSKHGSSPAIPDGGLLVTQNGKVIYRSVDSTGGQARPRLQTAARRLIHRVEPDYPSAARAQHIEGTIVLDTEIRPGGEIGKVVVVSGNALLADAAVQAVKQWRYEANPDTSQTRISLNFALPANTGP
ncbi:MAG: TonB family protein [Candidatus Sulfotelmatobacter sp.]